MTDVRETDTLVVGAAAAGLAAAARARLRLVAWAFSLGALGSGVLLQAATGRALLFTWALLGLGAGTLLLSYGRGWRWKRWPVALAVDVLVLRLVIVATGADAAAAGAPSPGAVLPLALDALGLPQRISLLHVEDCSTDGVPINPRRLFWRLSQQVPPGTRLYADAGNAFFWASHYWHPRCERVVEANRMPISMGFAAMGWAMGAAIGGKLAGPRNPVLCITGDGSYLMNAQEISVAQQLGINVVLLVLNNGVLGTVKHGQRMRGLEDTGNELPATDFALMARAMGIESHRIRSLDELDALGVASLFRREMALLLDVLVDPAIAPPIGQRVRNLQAPA